MYDSAKKPQVMETNVVFSPQCMLSGGIGVAGRGVRLPVGKVKERGLVPVRRQHSVELTVRGSP